MLPLQLHSTQPLRILCLGAHSDDIEIGCGGTLLRLLQERPGTEVLWVVLSGGGLREKEARASARDFLKNAGGSAVETHTFRDGYFPYHGAEVKDYFESLKAKLSPDVVFTHYRNDLHQDHRVVSELTRNTWRNHLLLEYEIPKYDGDLGQPNLFVPVSPAHAKRKCALLMKHFGTQRSKHWFDEETFLALMRLRGIESASPTRYAEAFHAHKVRLFA
jgi:LmbE family N-acetylglucosaminyl deacetylase